MQASDGPRDDDEGAPNDRREAEPSTGPIRIGRIGRRKSQEALDLSGHETFAITGLAKAIEGDFSPGQRIVVSAQAANGKETKFEALLRIDTPNEAQYYRHGGILQYVLRGLLGTRG